MLPEKNLLVNELTSDLEIRMSKFLERYNKSHWTAAKRILKYLMTTQELEIIFCGTSKGELIGYAGANWARDLDSRRSTTDYVFFLNRRAILWRSKRQQTVATSTTEAEYMSIYSAPQKAVWRQPLLQDLNYGKDTSTVLYQDNQGLHCFGTESSLPHPDEAH